jgi:iron-desferrioxamine transport system substrate-binding protein
MSEDGNVFERRSTTRRQFVVGGLAASAGLLAGRVPIALGAGGWTFTDDRGVKVTLSKRPTRIVAYASACAALYQWGVTPVGVFGAAPRTDPALKGLPWSKITVVGSVYGEIDVEKLLALKPDLIVSQWYPPPVNSPLFGFKDVSQQQTIGSQVPIIGLNGHTIATNQITRFAALAKALGVNLQTGTVATAHTKFTKAVAALHAAATAKSSLKILAVSGSQQYFYVAKPVDNGDLNFYKHRGLPLVVPTTSAPYWDSLSWEQAGKYQADGILYDARPYALPVADAQKIPTFAALPAVKAGQVGAWRVGPAPTYQAYAAAMNELVRTISGWRKLS